MRRRWLLVSLCLVVTAAGVIGVARLLARAAADHVYFAGEEARVQVIAHRGGSQLRPENTLEAFAHAVALGADIIEMDARSTSDGAVVCLHDAMLERTTDGAGRVDTMPLGELRKLDAGYRWSGDGGRSFPFRGRGITVPTLEEVLARFPWRRMVVEIKQPGAAFAKSLCTLLRGTLSTRRVLVASFSAESLASFREACPEVATSMSSREARLFVALSRTFLAATYSPPTPALQIPDRIGEAVVPTAGLIKDARGRNLKVHVWTINDEARMRELLALGVDGIMTDRPDLLLRLRGAAR